MNVKDTTKQAEQERKQRLLSDQQKKSECFITFRLSSEQLDKLKKNAAAEQRTISNYLRTKI
jgi:predicted DNA binding CopG/RHH family protein